MKLLFIGDIVGRAGRKVITEHLPSLRTQLGLDFVVANGENAASGFGITRKICDELFDAGVDVITGGNHSWDQREALSFIDDEPRLMRPANFPAGTPGRGVDVFVTSQQLRIGIINVMGRVFMDPLDDPFATAEAALDQMQLGRDVDFLLLDVHAEATSEKMAFGHFADGRASLVVGTHSHVPTADAQVLPQGTAYQTDAGMCGDYNSVIGMDPAEPLLRFTSKIGAGRFEPAMGPGTLCGVFVETDSRTGLAQQVCPVRVGGRLQASLPAQ